LFFLEECCRPLPDKVSKGNTKPEACSWILVAARQIFLLKTKRHFFSEIVFRHTPGYLKKRRCPLSMPVANFNVASQFIFCFVFLFCFLVFHRAQQSCLPAPFSREAEKAPASNSARLLSGQGATVVDGMVNIFSSLPSGPFTPHFTGYPV